MILRPYQPADLEALALLFTASVHVLAAGHYSAAQREAWAPHPPDLARWRARLAPLRTLVAEAGAMLAGFIAYAGDGHLHYLYCGPAFAGQGVAFLLYGCVEAQLRSAGVAQCHTEASLTARPFFERQGFVILQEQEVEVGGQHLRRLAMRKTLRPDMRVG